MRRTPVAWCREANVAKAGSGTVHAAGSSLPAEANEALQRARCRDAADAIEKGARCTLAQNECFKDIMLTSLSQQKHMPRELRDWGRTGRESLSQRAVRERLDTSNQKAIEMFRENDFYVCVSSDLF